MSTQACFGSRERAAWKKVTCLEALAERREGKNVHLFEQFAVGVEREHERGLESHT